MGESHYNTSSLLWTTPTHTPGSLPSLFPKRGPSTVILHVVIVEPEETSGDIGNVWRWYTRNITHGIIVSLVVETDLEGTQ